MIGHEKIISVFKGLANSGRLSHGYIFYGPEGTGKKTFASSLANFLEKGVFHKPGILIDSILISPNAEGSIGIDESRRLKEFLFMKPNASSRRTAIIDKAEKMTPEAQNAVLKIAEEPPASSLIIIVIKEPELLLPTLLSRFQKIYFPPLKESDVKTWLTEELGLRPAKAAELAKRSFGSPGVCYALTHDEKFKKLIRQAETFLSAPTASLKGFLKDMIDEDDFNFVDFMDALIFCLPSQILGGKTWEGEAGSALRVESRFNFWHAVLELRRRLEFANLNPRIQLINLSLMARK